MKITLDWDNEDLVDCVEICLNILNLILDYDFEFRVIKFYHLLR